MVKYIYLAFYCETLDDKEKPFDKYQFLSYHLTGPFTHVQLCTSGKQLNNGVKCINLTQTTGKAQYGDYDFRRNGYCFYQVPVADGTWMELDKLCNAVDKSDIFFSKLEFFGVNRCCRQPCSLEKTRWTCSELIVWILQKCRVLPEDMDPYFASCTDVYLMIRKVKDARPCEKHPFFNQFYTESPDNIYAKFKGLPDLALIDSLA